MPRRSLVVSMVGNRCPRCRQGRLFLNKNPYAFKDIEKMPQVCPKCNQDFVIEPGFYFGATYVSYALNVAWLIPMFLFLRFAIGWSALEWQSLVTLAIVLPALVPIIFRLSRSIWIHFFVKYDPNVALQVEAEDVSR